MWAPAYLKPAGTAPAPTAPTTAAGAPVTAPTAPETAGTAPADRPEPGALTMGDVQALACWLEGRGVLVTSAIIGDRVAIEVWNTRGSTTARHEYGADGAPLRRNAPKGLTRTMAAAFAALAIGETVAA